MSKQGLSLNVKIQMAFWALFMPIALIWSIFAFLPDRDDMSGKLSVIQAQEIRTEPVGHLVMPGEGAAVAAVVAKAPPPAETYKAVCAACHDTGLLDSPKFGDQAVWDERISAVGGFDALVASAITGKGSMPPKGGASLNDEDFQKVVAYIAGKAEATPAEIPALEATEEPAAPAEAPTTPAPAVEPEPAAEPQTTETQTETAVETATKKPETAAAATVAVAKPTAEAAETQPETTVADIAADFDPSKTYNTICAACHATGVLNAPKMGDAAVWEARVAKLGSFDAIVASAIKGKGAMPPKGGAISLSDAEFRKVVEYQSGLK